MDSSDALSRSRCRERRLNKRCYRQLLQQSTRRYVAMTVEAMIVQFIYTR